MVAPPPNYVTTPSRTYNRSEPKKYAIQTPGFFQRLDLEMLMRTLNSSQAGIA